MSDYLITLIWLLDSEGKGFTILRNLGNYWPNDKVQHSRRTESSGPPMWEPHILHNH